MLRNLCLVAMLVSLGLATGQAPKAQALGQARLWDDPGPCDRECLIDLTDRYLAAIVARDPSAAPLARNLRFTENTVLLDSGEITEAEHMVITSLSENGLVFGISQFRHPQENRTLDE